MKKQKRAIFDYCQHGGSQFRKKKKELVPLIILPIIHVIIIEEQTKCASKKEDKTFSLPHFIPKVTR